MNAFTQFAMEVRACGGQMMSNAAYIQKELPGIDMPDELRSQIEKLCTDLVGSRFDLNTEANEFEGAIAANANLDALTRKAEMVRGWIAGDIGSIQACVEAVTNAVEAGTASPILSMLIMESAVNIFNATPTWPATEEVAEEQEEPGDEDHDIGNDCYGFYCEDSYPVGQLADAIGQLMERPELCAETIEQLRTFRFAMDRLPLVTAGI